MHRYTLTEKWSDPWFSELKPHEKLVFMYVVDNCNNAGFYEINYRRMAFDMGFTEPKIKGALKGLARGLIEVSGWVWVKNFLRVQKNDSLNPENNAHKQIINLIKDQIDRFKTNKKFPTFLELNEGLFRGSLGPHNPSKRGPGIGTGKGTLSTNKSTNAKASNEKEVIEFCKSLKLPSSDGSYLWNKWEGNGWENGGKKIKDWKATIRSWKSADYLPSQKNQLKGKYDKNAGTANAGRSHQYGKI